MNKKFLIAGIMTITLVGLSSMFISNFATAETSVNTTVSELNHKPEKFQATLVKVEGKVLNWTQKTFQISVTDDQGNVYLSNFTRKFLTIQDLNSSVTLLVMPTKDIPVDFITEGQMISATGYIKSLMPFLYHKAMDGNTEEQKLPIQDNDAVLVLTSLTNSIGETLNFELPQHPGSMEKQNNRNYVKNNIAEYSVEVIDIHHTVLNISVSSDDFYRSHIVEFDVVKVKDLASQKIYLLNLGLKHKQQLPSGFISVNDQIQIKGVIIDFNLIKERQKYPHGCLPLPTDVDGVLLGFSVTDASGDTYQPSFPHQHGFGQKP